MSVHRVLICVAATAVACSSGASPIPPKPVTSPATSPATAALHAPPTRRAQPSLLDRVPVNTPYLAASVAPMTFAELAVIFRRPLTVLQARLIGMDPTTAGNASRPVVDRMLAAVTAQMGGELSPRGLAAIGFASTLDYALYGLGVAPVLLVRIADAAKLRTAIDGVLGRMGTPKLWQRTHRGRSYWYLEQALDGLSIAIAIDGDALVLAVTDDASRNAVVDHILRLTKPSATLANSARLQRMTSQLGMHPWHVGFVDTVALAGAATGKATGLLAQTTQNFGMVTTDPHCVAELPTVAAAFPSVAFGIDGISRLGHRVAFAVETSPRLRDKLRALSAQIPGQWPGDRIPELGIGVALDLGRLIAFMQTLMRSVTAKPYQCPTAGVLNRIAGSSQAKQILTMGARLPPVHGANLWLTRVGNAGARNTSGSLVVGTTTPISIVGMLLPLVPTLRGKTIVADAPPMRIQHSFMGELWLAATANAFGIAFGPDGDSHLATTLADESHPTQVLIDVRISLNGLRMGPRFRRITPVFGVIDAGRDLASLRYTLSSTRNGVGFELEPRYRP